MAHVRSLRRLDTAESAILVLNNAPISGDRVTLRLLAAEGVHVVTSPSHSHHAARRCELGPSPQDRPGTVPPKVGPRACPGAFIGAAPSADRRGRRAPARRFAYLSRLGSRGPQESGGDAVQRQSRIPGSGPGLFQCGEGAAQPARSQLRAGCRDGGGGQEAVSVACRMQGVDKSGVP